MKGILALYLIVITYPFIPLNFLLSLFSNDVYIGYLPLAHVLELAAGTAKLND
jgi:hypothetical protein